MLSKGIIMPEAPEPSLIDQKYSLEPRLITTHQGSAAAAALTPCIPACRCAVGQCAVTADLRPVQPAQRQQARLWCLRSGSAPPEWAAMPALRTPLASVSKQRLNGLP